MKKNELLPSSIANKMSQSIISILIPNNKLVAYVPKTLLNLLDLVD